MMDGTIQGRQGRGFINQCSGGHGMKYKDLIAIQKRYEALERDIFQIEKIQERIRAWKPALESDDVSLNGLWKNLDDWIGNQIKCAHGRLDATEVEFDIKRVYTSDNPPIDEVGFSTRVLNGLNAFDVETLKNVTKLTEVDILKSPTLGRGSLEQIKGILGQFGLELSPNVPVTTGV
jgi:hypothetical protein